MNMNTKETATRLEKPAYQYAPVLKVLCAGTALLLFKWSSGWGCTAVAAWLLLTVVVIGRQMFSLRISINTIFCDAWFKKSSIFNRLFKSRILVFLLSAIIALLLALSVLSFVYNSLFFNGVALFINALVFVWLYNKRTVIGKNHFTDQAAGVLQEIVVIFINVILFYIIFLLLHLINVNYFWQALATDIFSPDIPAVVASTVHHDCLMFQHYVRTTRFLDLTVDQLHGMEGLAWYIYYIVFLIQHSFFPFLGITFVFRAFINLRWFRKKKGVWNGAPQNQVKRIDPAGSASCSDTGIIMQQSAQCNGMEGTLRHDHGKV